MTSYSRPKIDADELISRVKDVKSKTTTYIIAVIFIILFVLIMSSIMFSSITIYIYGGVSSKYVAELIAKCVVSLVIIISLSTLALDIFLYVLFKSVNDYACVVDKIYFRSLLQEYKSFSYVNRSNSLCGVMIGRAYKLIRFWIALAFAGTIIEIAAVISLYSVFQEALIELLSTSGSELTAIQGIGKETIIIKMMFSNSLITLITIALNTLWLIRLVLIFLYSRIVVSKLSINEYGNAIIAYIVFCILDRISGFIKLPMFMILIFMIPGILFIIFLWNGVEAVERQAINIIQEFSGQPQDNVSQDLHGDTGDSA